MNSETTQIQDGAGATVRVAPKILRKPSSLEDKLLTVYQRLEALDDRPHGRVIEFVPVNPGAATSALLCWYAQLASRRLGRRILLLACDANSKAMDLAPSKPASWEDAIQEGKSIDERLVRVGDGSLAVGLLARTREAFHAAVASPNLQAVLANLRHEYDCIIIEAPRVVDSSGAVLLAPLTDGVVFVVETEKTRWQSLEHEIDQMKAQGAKILGVILNRRKYYIPRFVYDRL